MSLDFKNSSQCQFHYRSESFWRQFFQWHNWWNLGLCHYNCVARAVGQVLISLFLLFLLATSFKIFLSQIFSALPFLLFTAKQFNCTFVFIIRKYFDHLLGKEIIQRRPIVFFFAIWGAFVICCPNTSDSHNSTYKMLFYAKLS